MSRSEKTRFLEVVAIVALLVMGAFNFSQKNTTDFMKPTQEPRYHGEFGLYVTKVGKKVNVHWINQTESPGTFEVSFNGKSILNKELKTSRTHAVEFSYDEEGEYSIKFGSKDNTSDQQETTLYLLDEVPRAPFDVKNVDKVFAIGDTHGYYDHLRQLLIANKIMDDDQNWIAGDSHLVFVGDLYDRGHDVTKNLWMIYQLEHQAKEAGGAIHIVLGNHEIMTFTNDLRYVSPKENSTAAAHGVTYREMYDLNESLLGQWLASKPSLLRIDRLLFAHGGMIMNYGDFSLNAINDSIYAFMQESEFPHLRDKPVDSTQFDMKRFDERLGFFYGEFAPYWYRGYVQSKETTNELNLILNKFDSRIHIVGHTSQETITQYHRGKLIATDLNEKATEMLLLTKKGKKKYNRYKLDSEGNQSKL